ncbi:leucine-rich repeat neuronal protein 4 [Trichomycterus rosablanca]|uniref:leucine-rich repeat neuronal protein 4 n=1 Tax=Trichomycterus rosablanca TaxID=2290929 RepID=UPI002F35DA61
MMQNVTLLLLLLTLDLLLAVSVKLPASQLPDTNIPIRYFPEVDDYDYEETTKPSVDHDQPKASTTHFIPRECHYDPCVVPEVPCSVISAQTRCYCPGITGPDELPVAPQLKELKQGERGELEVHWCAPQSTVTHYEVVVEGGSHDPQVYSESTRVGMVQGVRVGSRVCVVAVNNAGISGESETSCARFELPESSRAALTSGVAAGGVVLLVLILVVALLLWRRRNSRKSGAVDGEGLKNPSYTTNGTL